MVGVKEILDLMPLFVMLQLKLSVTSLTTSITKIGLILTITTGHSLMLKVTLVTITLDQVSSVLDIEWLVVILISVLVLLLPDKFLISPLIPILELDSTLMPLLLGIMKPTIPN
jgi:hypothetical protein